MPRATNCSRTKSCARRIASAWLSSRGSDSSISRASDASLRRSLATTSFHSVSRSSHRRGAPSGSRISEWITPALARKFCVRPSSASYSAAAAR